MGVPEQPLTLTPEDLKVIEKRLADLRHNVNNCLALIIAANELIKAKPDALSRMANTIGQQPKRIEDEVQNFSAYLEKQLGITRSGKLPLS